MNNLKKEILDNLKNTYCRLKPSTINGMGVFAIRDIPKGVNPFYETPQHRWLQFTMTEIKKLDKGILKLIDDFFVIEKDGTVYIPKYGLNGLDISFFVNNSKKPNLKIVGDGKESVLDFITHRKIKKNEELTVRYERCDDKNNEK